MADNMSIEEVRLRSVLGPSAPQERLVGESGARGAANQATQGPSFSETLADSIQEVNRLQLEASAAVEDLVTGKNRDVHSATIALQKAGISFKLMMEVRSKIVDAYKEVMRMQI